jgi:hypothetical protein
MTTMIATFSDDRALAVARGLLNRSVVLAFRADAFLHRIDELQRRIEWRLWELETRSRDGWRTAARPRTVL